MIDVKKVSEKKDLIDFVKFPFKLYKKSKYWVPPIIDQEINNFNKDLNPNLKKQQKKRHNIYRINISIMK